MSKRSLGLTATKADVRAIKGVIVRQSGALSWSRGNTGDWDTFAPDFVDGATLFPAARPIKPQSVDASLTRMKNLARTELDSLQETVLGSDIKVFGNNAFAIATCGMVENGVTDSQTVEMLLLVKTDGAWRIAAQAWDRASGLNPIPDSLLANAGRSTG